VKMIRLIALITIVALLAGCGFGTKQPVAGLAPQPPEALAAWGGPASVIARGDGNSYRVVKGPSLAAEAALELAAGGQGGLEYWREATAGSDMAVRGRLLFLSTQGAGRVKVAALDAAGQVLASVGWVYTGPMPAAGGRTKWLDARYTANYVGDWLEFNENIAGLFAAQLPGLGAPPARYRVSVEVGQGQHALITSWNIGTDPARTVSLSLPAARLTATLGETVSVVAEVENASGRPLENTVVELVEPYGYGLVAGADKFQPVATLAPGEKRRLVWQVKAQRPDAVNFGQPWPLAFAVNGAVLPVKAAVAVSDPRPGRVFYVMTEDLEAIDAAGYAVAWGNADGWLQPQELVTQMVTKAEKANSIAAKYGAKWTHYIAWPLIRAAEWAGGQSTSGLWPQAAAAVKRSVREQAAAGHEYALHLHSDYDPYLPGNVLSYNPAVDGLWADHLRHGWAHSLGREGNYNDYTSRTGFLYSYQREMDELLAESGQGQLITSRVGSFDFGNGPASEAASIRTYRKVGLWGSSDADGNQGGITAGDWSRAIYLTKPDDINSPADDLKNIGLVEFRPTPRDFIGYDSQSAAQMNDKVDAGMAYYKAGSQVRPGVHAIVGFTHVMFLMGEGGWQATEGGQFAALDAHLAYLKTRYVDQGLLAFGTADELVRTYLDYYTPYPVAVYGPRQATGWGVSEYPVVLLGRDIPIDSAHPHTVTLKYPLYLRDSAYRISVLKNGEPIYSTWGLPTPANSIAFTVDDGQAKYSIKVYHIKNVARLAAFLQAVKAKIAGIGH
jgi:hypothetical protein